MSVARCQHEVSSVEFTRWMAHLHLSAFEREEAQAKAAMHQRMMG